MRCPIPISDLAAFDRSKDNLNSFLNCLAKKLPGDAAQFTSEIHLISYLVSRPTGDAFEQIRGSYATYTTILELTNVLKAAFGDPEPKATA